MSKIVAIVGRPNVGKSTLFNRLTGNHRAAIIHDSSGVTRDRHYGVGEWQTREFVLIDTGGYVTGSNDFFETAIRKQVETAIQESDLLLFMVDVDAGITDEDVAFAKFLRKSSKPVVVVANKTDNHARISQAAEFYKLGFDDIFSVSSINGSGTGDMLDKVIENLGVEDVVEKDDELPKFTIVGRPNVGKSTFLNTLLGEERSIVSNIAGTTRDAIHTKYDKFGKEFLLIDTAGIRKKGKVDDDVEFYSVMRAIKAIEESDVVFLIIDAKDGLEAQDVNIFQLAQNRRKGIVILVNKWDLVEKDTNTHKVFTEKIHEKIAPFKDVPIMFISALEKTRIFKALEVGMEVFENRKKRVPTAKLNEYILPIIENYPPPSVKGKLVRIKYVTQLPVNTPAFAFFCNLDQYFKESYRRFLENKIRDGFGFTGVPIQIFFRKK